jgi:hypothetical protein
MSDKLGPVEVEFVLDKKADAEAKKLKGSIDAVDISAQKAAKTFDKLSSQSTNSSTVIQKNYKREIGLIADIEKELKDLREAKQNAFSAEEIEKLNKKIQEAEAHLDEYNKLGRKTVDVNDDAGKSAGFFSSSLGKLLVTAGIVTGAVKIFKSIMESTSGSMLAMESTTYGLRTALDSLLKTVASKDWGNIKNLLSGGLYDSFMAGKDYKKQLEVIAGIKRDYALKEEDLNARIEEQRRIFYEDDSISLDKKIAAGDAMLKAMEEKSKLEIELAERTNRAVLDLSKEKNKISEEDLNYVLENFAQIQQAGKNYEVIEKQIEKMRKGLDRGDKLISGRLDGEALKKGDYKINLLVDTKVSQENLKELEKLRDALGPDAEKYAEKLKMYEKLTEKEKEIIGQSALAVKEADNQYAEESKRVFRMQQNMIDAKNKQLKDEADLSKQLSVQQELLNKAVAEGNNAEIIAIGARVVALQKELDLRKKIAGQVIDAAEFGGFVPTAISSGVIESPSVLPKVKKPQKTWEQQYREQNSLRPAPDKNLKAQEKQKKLSEQELDLLQQQRELREEIAARVGSLVMQLGAQLGMDEKTMNLLGTGMDTITQLAGGDFLGAATSLISGLITLIPNEAEKFARQIDEINKLIEKQQRLIDLSDRKGGKKEAIKSALDLYYQKEKDINQRINDLEDKRSTKKRRKEIAELREDLRLLGYDIEDAKQEFTDLFSGGIIENDLADSLARAFDEGKTSAADFASYMNDILKEAVMNVFKAQVLGPALTKVTEYMSKSLSDGFLSEDEINELNRMWAEAGKTSKQIWDNLTKNLDMNGADGDNTSLQGAIKGITEETASVIAGQMNAIRISQTSSISIMQSSLKQLMIISDNTAYCIYLKSIDDKLGALANNSLRSQGIA